METAKEKNRAYEEARRAYKQYLTPPPGEPSIWGEELQQMIEAGVFCPLTGVRKPNPDLDQFNAKAKHMIAELRQQAYPAKLLTEVPQCQLDMHVATMVPDKSFPMEAKKLEPGSPEAKVVCDDEIRMHAGRWRKYESTEAPHWSSNFNQHGTLPKQTMDFLEQMQLPKPTSVDEWRLIWREVGALLAAKHFISHTPVPVMDLPVADVVDSKEQLRYRAMCDERISFPFKSSVPLLMSMRSSSPTCRPIPMWR